MALAVDLVISCHQSQSGTTKATPPSCALELPVQMAEKHIEALESALEQGRWQQKWFEGSSEKGCSGMRLN